jgi:hypothetical protein
MIRIGCKETGRQGCPSSYQGVVCRVKEITICRATKWGCSGTWVSMDVIEIRDEDLEAPVGSDRHVLMGLIERGGKRICAAKVQDTRGVRKQGATVHINYRIYRSMHITGIKVKT